MAGSCNVLGECAVLQVIPECVRLRQHRVLVRVDMASTCTAPRMQLHAGQCRACPYKCSRCCSYAAAIPR